jgi:catechol 2,3-dioxygenase-like lactoylglutathione lyase family enzyme
MAGLLPMRLRAAAVPLTSTIASLSLKGLSHRRPAMPALNHIIVPAKDKDASAAFLAGILGVKLQPQWGPFRPVQTSNGVTLDFVDSKDVRTQHYAFLVEEDEFDGAFERLKKSGAAYFANHDRSGKGEINHYWGGRGVYFDDPNGHWMELLTRPYGSQP